MQKVRKAIIPVAGYGTRFLPFTKAEPKAMLPVVNVPAVQLVIEEAVSSGIEDIILVVGQHKEIIEAHFAQSASLEKHLEENGAFDYLETVKKVNNMANIRYIVQSRQLGTGHAVLAAKKEIGDQPFAVMFGDDVMMYDERPVLKQLIDQFEKHGKTVIGVKNVGMDNVSKYASVEYDHSDGDLYNVTAITEKPAKGTAKSDLAPLGRYVIRGGFFDLLERISPGVNNEYQLTDALGLEISHGGLLAYNFQGKRFDMGDVFGYLQANIEFALKNEKYSDKLKEYLKKISKNF